MQMYRAASTSDRERGNTVCYSVFIVCLNELLGSMGALCRSDSSDLCAGLKFTYLITYLFKLLCFKPQNVTKLSRR